jgi:L-fucose mutarotase/ribose pyranase (RbsD/FucU family)
MTELTSSTAPHWEHELSSLLPLFGHRNWIVVADSAYPAQSKPGIETIVASADQVYVVQRVMDAITACRHIRANVYADKELDFVDESDAPGISEYRKQLDGALHGSKVSHLPHDEIIHKLDLSAEVFSILIIKSDMTIPYTSVFFELDCGYWNSAAEERMRQAMLVADLS